MIPNSMSKPRPSPSEKRPPVMVCIVMAKVAVTIGWRVLWFVAAVAMPRRLARGRDGAAQRGGVLGVEPLRDEGGAQPDALGVAHLADQVPGRRGVPRERVEAQLGELRRGLVHAASP